MTLMSPEPTTDVGSARWWLNRLHSELLGRIPDMEGYRALVDDEHDAPHSSERAQKFQVIAGLSTTNLTGLAVEATAERFTVEGVRVGDDPDSDKDVWDNVWQRSDFDQGSQEATTAALVYARSFVSVEPPTVDSYARLRYEDPRQVVMSYLPDGSRGPALKVFTDEWTGRTFATLYTNDVIVKMERQGIPGSTQIQWLPREIRGEDTVTRNPLGEIPFFELQNKLTGSIRSEVAPLVIPQKRLNQIVFNTDAVAEFGAFRQKWATGIEVVRGPDGQPISPYEAGIMKMFVGTGEQAKFGNFDATEMKPYIELAQDVAAHISRLSRVPITYFLSNVSNLSGDALALLISGLVLKCQRRVKGYEPALEGAVRLALRTMGDPRSNAGNIEIKWADMETRSMAQSADAAVKLTAGDNSVITRETAQERYLGMSQTERDRDDAWRASQAPGSPVEGAPAAIVPPADA